MPLSRVLALVPAGAILAAITLGCGGSAAPTAPKAVAPSAAGTTITVAGAGGSFAAAIPTVNSQFTQATGIKVQYLPVTSLAAGLAQMQAQKSHQTYDVFLANEITLLADTSMWLPIPKDQMPNYKNLPAALQSEKTPNNLFIPYSASAQGLEYNKQVFDQKGWKAPTSYTDLLDPKYKGHIAIFPASFAGTSGLMAQLAPLYGGNYNNVTGEFDKFWTKLKPNVYTVVATSPLLDTAFTSGNAWISYNTTVRIKLLNDQSFPAAFATPKEGIQFVNGTAGVLKDGPNNPGAIAYLNFLLSDRVQAELATLVGTSPIGVNGKVPDNLKQYFPNPNDQKNAFYPDWAQVVARLPDWVNRFNAIFGQ
jgi:putative spermidine/putrescine transport system substrate-binding protein